MLHCTPAWATRAKLRLKKRKFKMWLLLKKKLINGSCYCMVRKTLFRTIVSGIGTTAMGPCSVGERLGSTPNTAISKKQFIARKQCRGISRWKTT